jgi:hypothetical protein
MNYLKLIPALLLAGVVQAQSSVTPSSVTTGCLALPEGAAAPGYTTRLFAIAPTVADVSTTDTNTNSMLYPGEEFTSVATNLRMLKYLSMVNGVFTMNYTGAAEGPIWISSETHQATQGALALLPGSKGFYIEAGIRLSSSDPDHYPSFFLVPAEHNTIASDHIPTSPRGYENWLEIDALEEELDTPQANLIMWQGIYPHYTRTMNFWRGAPMPFTWTAEHIYGVSFDPTTREVQYYLDGKPTLKASMATAPTIVDTYHYYFILGARSHGLNKPYQMFVSFVAAYTK